MEQTIKVTLTKDRLSEVVSTTIQECLKMSPKHIDSDMSFNILEYQKLLKINILEAINEEIRNNKSI